MEHKNTRKQGDHGLGAAIAYFTKWGWHVSIPLTDNQEYDLIADDGRGLKKVQVKTTRCKQSRSGYYHVDLRTHGGNRTRNHVKKFDPASVDLLFILTAAETTYLIPCSEITAQTYLELGPKYDDYRKS
jgi:hypothetical protein